MWTQELFGVEKPIIALLHLDAMPGDPGFCGKLETVAFPEGMQFFDGVTFHSCVNLKEVYVPTSATEFGSDTPIVDIKTCPNAVVITPAGSPAQKICEERGVPHLGQ